MSANSTCGELFTYTLSNSGVYCFIYGNLVAYTAICIYLCQMSQKV